MILSVPWETSEGALCAVVQRRQGPRQSRDSDDDDDDDDDVLM